MTVIHPCPICGTTLSEGLEICAFHPCVYGDNWAIENRAMCDFIHRGVIQEIPQPAPPLDEAYYLID